MSDGRQPKTPITRFLQKQQQPPRQPQAPPAGTVPKIRRNLGFVERTKAAAAATAAAVARAPAPPVRALSNIPINTSGITVAVKRRVPKDPLSDPAHLAYIQREALAGNTRGAVADAERTAAFVAATSASALAPLPIPVNATSAPVGINAARRPRSTTAGPFRYTRRNAPNGSIHHILTTENGENRYKLPDIPNRNRKIGPRTKVYIYPPDSLIPFLSATETRVDPVTRKPIENKPYYNSYYMKLPPGTLTLPLAAATAAAPVAQPMAAAAMPRAAAPAVTAPVVTAAAMPLPVATAPVATAALPAATIPLPPPPPRRFPKIRPRRTLAEIQMRDLEYRLRSGSRLPSPPRSRSPSPPRPRSPSSTTASLVPAAEIQATIDDLARGRSRRRGSRSPSPPITYEQAVAAEGLLPPRGRRRSGSRSPSPSRRSRTAAVARRRSSSPPRSAAAVAAKALLPIRAAAVNERPANIQFRNAAFYGNAVIFNSLFSNPILQPSDYNQALINAAGGRATDDIASTMIHKLLTERPNIYTYETVYDAIKGAWDSNKGNALKLLLAYYRNHKFYDNPKNYSYIPIEAELAGPTLQAHLKNIPNNNFTRRAKYWKGYNGTLKIAVEANETRRAEAAAAQRRAAETEEFLNMLENFGRRLPPNHVYDRRSTRRHQRRSQ
jgi:hypothetical protein